MIGRKVKVSRDIQKIFRWHDKLSISCTYWCRLYSQVLHKVVDLPLRPLFMPNDILFPITVTHSPVEFSKQVLFERSTTFPVFRCPCPNLILKHVACTETFQNLWGITLKKQNELHWAFSQKGEQSQIKAGVVLRRHGAVSRCLFLWRAAPNHGCFSSPHCEHSIVMREK